MSWKARKSGDRGHFDHGWLKTWHTFSFGDYRDPRWMGFGSLRVINEDVVAPGDGFDPHPHENMEIVTVVMDGALRHEDSMGNGSIIEAGDVQRMTAGSGIFHSEMNHSNDKPVHLFQIWILPNQRGLVPSYEQKKGSLREGKNRLQTLIEPMVRSVESASRDAWAVGVHQSVRLFYSELESKKELIYSSVPQKKYWVQVIQGQLQLEDLTLSEGDAAYSEAGTLGSFKLESLKGCRFFIFEIG